MFTNYVLVRIANNILNVVFEFLRSVERSHKICVEFTMMIKRFLNLRG